MERTGGCQCGRVRYRVDTSRSMLSVCHCAECQRQSGSAFGMSLITPAEMFSVEGPLKLFERDAAEGRRMRCWFCSECGTRIYHQPSHTEERVNIKAGTLDDTSWLTPQFHIWLRSKQSWTTVNEGAKTFDTQPTR
jgi:hypothetical protein